MSEIEGKPGKVPLAQRRIFFQKESHRPGHLAPGFDHQKSGGNVDRAVVNEKASPEDPGR